MNFNNRIAGKLVLKGAALALLAIIGATPLLVRAETPKNSATSRDIVETAVEAGQFKTLAAALEAAGLIDALKGSGPFTVFAPTDEAFAKLPAGTVEALLKPENKEKLKAILLYHVVSGNVPASEVLKLNGRSVKTLQGTSVMVGTKHGVRVNDAKVTQTDINASNGVIHVIDTVLIPKM
ncbi:MAG: fasciclin domain-containing protein [Pyrinomonadaceae bacterium]